MIHFKNQPRRFARNATQGEVAELVPEKTSVYRPVKPFKVHLLWQILLGK